MMSISMTDASVKPAIAAILSQLATVIEIGIEMAQSFQKQGNFVARHSTKKVKNARSHK
jgi:hypothetical protein